MSPGMQVCLAEARDRIPLDRESWNALAGRNAVSTVFQTWEWFDTWWAAFGDLHGLHFLTVHSDGSPVGFMALMRVRGPLGLRVLEFAGSPNADYQDLVLPPGSADALSAVVDHLHANRRGWDMIVLRNLPAGSPTVGALTAECRRRGLGVMNMEPHPCPTLRLAGRDEEIRSLLQRYSLRRVLRKLEQHGAVALRTLESAEECQRALPAFFDQHVRRWQGADAPSPFADPRYRQWYAALAEAARRAGWLHFTRLDCGVTAAAYHFGFCFGGTLSWYKPSFNPELQRDSPGTALIVELIRDALRRGCAELDFAGGLEPFKARFSNDHRETVNLRIFSRATLHRLYTAGGRLRGTLRGMWHRVRLDPHY